MDKKLKKTIEELKLTDKDLQEWVKSRETPDVSTDDGDDSDDESEEQPDSDGKEAAHAEPAPAQKEKPKKGSNTVSSAELVKLIAEGVLAAQKAQEDAAKLPAQKPLTPPKKPEPKAKPAIVANPGWQLIG
jgi:hypothetical protein